MPKFVIERDLPDAGKLTEEEVREASLVSLEVLRQLGPEIQWIHSYVTDDKIYCIYYAPDEFMIPRARPALRHPGRPYQRRAPLARSGELRDVVSPVGAQSGRTCSDGGPRVGDHFRQRHLQGSCPARLRPSGVECTRRLDGLFDLSLLARTRGGANPLAKR